VKKPVFNTVTFLNPPNSCRLYFEFPVQFGSLEMPVETRVKRNANGKVQSFLT